MHKYCLLQNIQSLGANYNESLFFSKSKRSLSVLDVLTETWLQKPSHEAIFTQDNFDLLIVRGGGFDDLTSSKNQQKLVRKTSKKQLQLLTVTIKDRDPPMMITAVFKSPSLDYTSFKEELIDHIFNVAPSASMKKF